MSEYVMCCSKTDGVCNQIAAQYNALDDLTGELDKAIALTYVAKGFGVSGIRQNILMQKSEIEVQMANLVLIQKTLSEIKNCTETYENNARNLIGKAIDKIGNTDEIYSGTTLGGFDIFIAKPYILPSILALVSPVTSLLYLASGIPIGNKPSFRDHSRTSSAHSSVDRLGYKYSDGNPGVTAWIGKASAEAQNEWGYAGVNAYLGKGEANAKADAGIMKTTHQIEYQDGKWDEKSRTHFITVEAGASASVSAMAGDAEAGVGSDMLGAEGKAEGSVGTAKAEAKGKFSVGEDGVNANVEGEAMVAAAEGEASGTIDFLGLEITGKVGGYAGAVGVKGKVGIEDNKFVLEGGAAALIGGSAGVEIGFNDEGWDNFVDFFVFWD